MRSFLIGIAAALVLALCGIGGYAGWKRYERDQNFDACLNNVLSGSATSMASLHQGPWLTTQCTALDSVDQASIWTIVMFTEGNRGA